MEEECRTIRSVRKVIVAEKKNQLIELETSAINTNAGILDLYDVFIYRLKLEESELLNSINTIIKNL